MAVDRYGPTAVSINVGQDFFDYDSGIYNGMCSSKPKEADHGILIAGYEKDAWLIKNSWGESWGQDGYAYMRKGKNLCGIANQPIFTQF